MTDLQTAYQTATAAVRAYTALVNDLPNEERPTFLLLADDPTREPGDCDCIITGSAPGLDLVLSAAASEVPRLACAIVVCAEGAEVKQTAINYIANRPWPTTPNHIPCGQCGACAANEPCARLY